MGINLKSADLIYPYFVVSGINKKEKIKDFPDVFRFSADRLIRDIWQLKRLGLGKILLFGVPDSKDPEGSTAYKKDNVIASTVKKIKNKFPNLIVMTDVCLCAYTTHGHCGIINRPKTIDNRLKKEKFIDNKKTLEALSKIALSHAEAGADWVAPSAMARRQVAAIRQALDKNGYKNTKIMGYSAKFASNFYGPFRNAASSRPAFGDRSAYQLSYADGKKALREIEDDIKEGADIVMVKPALAYLDIIKEVKTKFNYPLAAYNVSGEYAMVKAYCERSREEKKMVLEILTGIKRAGTDLIITYHAKDVAKWLKE